LFTKFIQFLQYLVALDDAKNFVPKRAKKNFSNGLTLNCDRHGLVVAAVMTGGNENKHS
jgi:hypothetical protein